MIIVKLSTPAILAVQVLFAHAQDNSVELIQEDANAATITQEGIGDRVRHVQTGDFNASTIRQGASWSTSSKVMATARGSFNSGAAEV